MIVLMMKISQGRPSKFGNVCGISTIAMVISCVGVQMLEHFCAENIVGAGEYSFHLIENNSFELNFRLNISKIRLFQPPAFLSKFINQLSVTMNEKKNRIINTGNLLRVIKVGIRRRNRHSAN